MNRETAKRAFEAYQKVKPVFSMATGLDFDLIKHLWFLRHNENYRMVAGNPTLSWAAFLREEFPAFKYYTVTRWIKIYDVYIHQLGLEPKDLVGYDTNLLQRLANHVTKSTVKRWLLQTRNLGRDQMYRRLSTNKNMARNKITHD